LSYALRRLNSQFDALTHFNKTVDEFDNRECLFSLQVNIWSQRGTKSSQLKKYEGKREYGSSYREFKSKKGPRWAQFPSMSAEQRHSNYYGFGGQNYLEERGPPLDRRTLIFVMILNGETGETGKAAEKDYRSRNPYLVPYGRRALCHVCYQATMWF
jgi:hypothetical protein